MRMNGSHREATPYLLPKLEETWTPLKFAPDLVFIKSYLAHPGDGDGEWSTYCLFISTSALSQHVSLFH